MCCQCVDNFAAKIDAFSSALVFQGSFANDPKLVVCTEKRRQVTRTDYASHTGLCMKMWTLFAFFQTMDS